jgi:hypothetical protein
MTITPSSVTQKTAFDEPSFRRRLLELIRVLRVRRARRRQRRGERERFPFAVHAGFSLGAARRLLL